MLFFIYRGYPLLVILTLSFKLANHVISAIFGQLWIVSCPKLWPLLLWSRIGRFFLVLVIFSIIRFDIIIIIIVIIIIIIIIIIILICVLV